MNKIRTTVIALAVMASPALADNERGFYAGAGFAMLSGNSYTPYESADMPVAELSAGYKYNAFLGLEARFGLGLDDDRDNDSAYFEALAGDMSDLTQIEREIDQFSAIYYRPELTNNKARLYGLIGYAEVDLQASFEEVDAEGAASYLEATTNLKGPSYGFGVGWFIDDHWNFNLEYRQLVRTDDFRVEAFSMQFDYRF